MNDTAVTDEQDPTRRRQRLAEVGMLLAWWAEQQPDTPAIITADSTRTFAELNADANRLVRALRSRGVVAGDAVAVACRNRPEFVEATYACQRGGYRLTTVNWHLTADEAGYIVENCEARALLADVAVADMARGAAADAPACSVLLAIGGPIDGFEDYDGALAAEDGSDIDDPSAGSSMLYTSGTTGRPKGVYRPPTAHVAPALNIYDYHEGEGDVHLCTGPLYHAAPLAFSLTAPLSFGATVVLMDQWDAAEALRLVDAHAVTHTHMVPTMFHRLLSLPADARARCTTDQLRYVLHGAAPCPVPVKQRLIDWLGPVVVEYYAATEGVGSFVDSATWLARPGTVGRPVTEGQVLIGDEDANPLPADEIGLVWLKAMPGARFDYYKDPDKTSGSYRGDYFTLGDVGYLDTDGYLFLTDRSANLIISGGVNIYPAEVDAVLLEHPAVGDAATIGVPDEEWGERVTSIIEVQPGLTPSDELAAELIAFCRDRISHFKCPRSVDFIDTLPRHDNGKVYRRRLKELFATPPDPGS